MHFLRMNFPFVLSVPQRRLFKAGILERVRSSSGMVFTFYKRTERKSKRIKESRPHLRSVTMSTDAGASVHSSAWSKGRRALIQRKIRRESLSHILIEADDYVQLGPRIPSLQFIVLLPKALVFQTTTTTSHSH